MKKLILIMLFVGIGFVNIAYSQEAEQKSVAVTIYNANLGVVKDLREIDVTSGRSKIKITNVAQLIDPTSVHIKLDGEVLDLVLVQEFQQFR